MRALQSLLRGTTLLVLLALGSTAAVFAAPTPTGLRAGAATSNITPRIGVLRVGGFAPAPTVHVHDEMHARCLVLDDGRTKVAMVVCDLLGFHRSVSIEARRLIEEATGIPPSHVLISATHTHSGGSALGKSRYVNEQQLSDYQQFVAERIADGVRRAMYLLRPAEVAFGSLDIPEHIINRRWFIKASAGRANPWGKVEQVYKTSAPGPEFIKPAGPIDPAVSFIAVREPAGRLISVYSAYSLHYVGFSMPGGISADYFGAYCEALKRLVNLPGYATPFVALMANATSGDIGLNQARYRHFDKEKDPYGRSWAVGSDIAEKVHAALGGLTWQADATLDARFREPELGWRAIGPELLEWAKEVEAKAPRLPSGNLPIYAKWATTREWVSKLSYAGRVQVLAAKTQPARVPMQVLRIGDICIGSSPCETYAEIGLEFKQRSPFANSFMVELGHAMLGYLPTPHQFQYGEYSTWPGTNILERQTSVKLLDNLVEMAGELKQIVR